MLLNCAVAVGKHVACHQVLVGMGCHRQLEIMQMLIKSLCPSAPVYEVTRMHSNKLKSGLGAEPLHEPSQRACVVCT